MNLHHNEKDNITDIGNSGNCLFGRGSSATTWLPWLSGVEQQRAFGEFRRQTTFYTGLTTSHGYQIDPMFFIGAGLGMERCGSLGNWVAPVFVEGRADFEFGK